MKLLAFDTATAACSVALYDGDTLLASVYQLRPREQAQLLLPMIDQVLRAANYALVDLDALAVTVGPGSFVGLRIAIGIAQGLAFAYDLPVIPVSTLAALAQTAYRLHGYTHSAVALDAHQKEIYFAAYQVKDELVRPVIKDCLVYPENVSNLSGTWVGVGNGWDNYLEVLTERLQPSHSLIELYPYAQDVASLARVQQPIKVAELEPVYLRDEGAWKTANSQ